MALELKKQTGKVAHLNVREEKHGEESVVAVDVKVEVEISNQFLDTLVEGMREASVFASMDSLRKPLRNYKNPTPPGESMDEYFAKVDAIERSRHV